ncbi:MAG TPA: hypothetical protein VND65_17720 [Candidatus Binatia bacterium]|nr:hypothetical protein [Candidatus Binatia bacterium]
MESVTGVFRSISAAQQTTDDLVRHDILRDSIVLLSREEPRYGAKENTLVRSEQDLNSVPTSPASSSGAGKAHGAGLGATIGGAAGFTAAATAGVLMIPGLGTVFAIGMGAAALLGLGGAAIGAKLGETMENNVDTGVPPERVQLYRQILENGYSLVIVNVRGGSETAAVNEVLQQHGSQDLESVKREIGKAA